MTFLKFVFLATLIVVTFGCTDDPSYWEDSMGYDCEKYTYMTENGYDWCNKYGDDESSGGVRADVACCGCGGGDGAGGCRAHSDCSDSTYCDDSGGCYDCDSCDMFDDAFDGACPAKCTEGGSSGDCGVDVNGECTDVPGWDEGYWDCEDYAYSGGYRCDSFGDSTGQGNDGVTYRADEACCICDGGTYPELTCAPAVECDATEVANSDHATRGTITGAAGDIVEITCDDGYGDSVQLTCDEDGVWSRLSCDAVACTATEVANSDLATRGSITGNTGDTVEVTCDTGYGRGSTATCGTDGTFNAITCAAGGCTATEVANSDQSATGAITGVEGDTVAVTCAIGYSGSATATCSSGSFNTVTCTGDSCTATEVADSDYADTGSITGVTGETVTVSCTAGYEGGGVVTCGSDGEFSIVNCEVAPTSAPTESETDEPTEEPETGSSTDPSTLLGGGGDDSEEDSEEESDPSTLLGGGGSDDTEDTGTNTSEFSSANGEETSSSNLMLFSSSQQLQTNNVHVFLMGLSTMVYVLLR